MLRLPIARTANAGKVATLIAEMAAASKEQSQGIDQINTAVAEMDKVVQRNAANAEESASAAEELSSQAEDLSSMVGELTSIVTGATATPLQRSEIGGGQVRAHLTATASPKKQNGPVHRLAMHAVPAAKAKDAKPESVIPLDDNELRKF